MTTEAPIPMTEQPPPQGMPCPPCKMPWQPIVNVPEFGKGELGGQECFFLTMHSPMGALTYAWTRETAEQCRDILTEMLGGIQVVNKPGLFVPGR